MVPLKGAKRLLKMDMMLTKETTKMLHYYIGLLLITDVIL